MGKLSEFFKNPFNILFPNFALANKSQYDAYKAYKLGKKRPDPRGDPGLQDKSFSPADYGVPLTIGFGKFKTNGKVIDGFAEHRESSNNSYDGGQHIITRTYYQNMAWKICEGPIIGISRIWLDDELLLDVRSGTTGAIGERVSSYAVDADGVVSFFRNTSGDGEYWTIYPGTDTQTPSSVLEALHGVGNVSAYRGWCYIVVDNLFLNDYGNRVPNLTAEVVKGGEVQSSNDLHTLDRQADSPGSALSPVAPGLMYDALNARVISVVNVSSGVMRWQMESVNPVTNTDVWSKSNTNYSGNAGTVGYALDLVRGVVWLRDGQRVLARILSDGSQTVETIEGSASTETQKGIGVHEARDELWVTKGTTQFVILSRSAILSGATFTAATLNTISNPFGTSGAVFAYHAPSSRLFVKSASSGREFVFYDSTGAISSTFSIGETGETCSQILPDPDNNFLWAITNNTASGLARCLRKIDLASMSDTVVLSGLGAEFLCIAKDSGRDAIITYRSSDKSLIWVHAQTHAIIKTYDITTDVNSAGAPKQLCFVPAYGHVYATFQEVSLIQYKLDYIVSDAVALSDVITDLSAKVGIQASDLDVTAVASTTINGIAIEDRSQAKATLDVLQRASFFDLVLEDGKIKAKKRGGASVMTIDYTELVLDDDDEQKRPYSFGRSDEIDIPERVEILYSDVDLDYEDGLQAATRHVVRSQEIEKQTIPILMTASQAKQVAEVELYSRWAQRTAIQLNGTRKHWKLRAGDVFTFVDELGVSRTLLCTRMEISSMTTCIIEARQEDATVYTSTVTGAGSGWTPPVITATTTKRFELLDIPILRDSDDYQGFYVAALTGAPTAYLHESLDGGVTYTNIGAIAESVIGYASTTLATFAGGNVWDTVSTVTVVVYDGTLSSATDAQLLAGVNSFLIGNEIVQAGTVTPAGANTYTLTRLLRGRRGTEWAVGLHSAGERFVDLTTIGRIASSLRGSLAYYKAVPSNVEASTISATAFTNTQAGMKPYSPVKIAGTRDGGLNLTLTWVRRSRIGTAWGSVIDIPLDDTLEKYEIDIMSGSVVKRTITVTSATTASYSAADQTTDFGTTQSSILVNVYQLSTIVGRGTVGVATV